MLEPFWIVTKRMVEEAAYSLVEKIEQVEIRQYPRLLVASVTDLGDNDAFWLLFRYISGTNKAQQKIAMTAPVITSSQRMSFVMPEKFTRGSLPVPRDERVQIDEIESRTVAVLRFKGYARQKEAANHTEELLTILKEHGRKIAGEPFLMRYNAPYVPGFLRRNEVGIEVVE
jgi:hypothetical protein